MKLHYLLAVALSAGNIFAALALDGAMNITGTITDNTCVVSADSQNLTVELGNVSSKQFYQAGAATRYEPFTIHLERCDAAASRVSVTFIGSSNSANSQLLALTDEAQSAQGVGIGLYDSNKTPIAINNASGGTALESRQANVALPFFARYVADGNTVSAGAANATLTFTLTYE